MLRHARPKSRLNQVAYGLCMCAAFAVGTTPAFLSLAVDPYEIFSGRNRESAISDLAEKAHYPLYKLAKYSAGNHRTIVLGDSRARSLRDKYWHEAGLTDALNLAYGGGTIPEIYATFNHIKSDPAVQTLVVGIQLRSFDEDHKGGMNRVPEALQILDHPLSYATNWTVAKASWRVFSAENEEPLSRAASLLPQIIGPAGAAELPNRGPLSLSQLLSNDVCYSCSPPTSMVSVPYSGRKTYHEWQGVKRQYYGGLSSMGAADWDGVRSFYNGFSTSADLPPKFARHGKKNGSADWRGFELSEQYWQFLREISSWAKNSGRRLIFVIPPTIDRMQETIVSAGLERENHFLRAELTALGDVVDFDFPNSLTANTDNFTDAYHLNSDVSREIAEELARLIDPKAFLASSKSDKNERVQCPSDGIASINLPPNLALSTDLNCRVWQRSAS